MRRGHPGWAPAFVLAGGLVIEESGLLSHTSIIARERGLPAVINVPGATERLRDGQRVEVDGRRGIVTLLEDGAP
jgi:pyruvate,water dikinase